jgi:hypothetical protein
MTKHEIFAQFFTDLLKLDNRLQAREIAREVWPATEDMWLHPMKIDDVLIELGLARVMDDGRMGYLLIDDSRGWRNDNWETELPTPEQETKLRAMAGKMLVRTVILQDGREVSWDALKEMGQKEHLYFQVPKTENDITFWFGPDHFPDSFVLAWVTPEEKAGGADAYMDNRCRSSDPDDFLSRIAELA